MFVSFCYISENFMKVREIFRTLLNVCNESFCKESQPFCIFTKSSEAVAQRCSVKKMFLELSQNSQENNCARVSFSIKLQTSACFPVNFAKFLRTVFLTEHLRRLFLKALFIDAWQSLKYASDFISHFKVINFLRLWVQ